MYRLSTEKRVLVLKCLTEGMSIRSTSRLTGVHQVTILNLLAMAGKVAAAYLDSTLRDLPCRRIQCDEIWSFIYAKEKNVPFAIAPPRKAGDVWTWIAECADTKLIVAWRVGSRTGRVARALMADLQPRLRYRVQITTDGHSPYIDAVENAFGATADYAQLIKCYSEKSKDETAQPTETDFITKRVLEGRPDEKHISTSFVERQNLTMRTFTRRFTRRTNGFSKKYKNHKYAVALYVLHYNFCWIHGTLKVTPPMEAGVADTYWNASDIVALIDEATPAPGPRGSYIEARRRRTIRNGMIAAAKAGHRKRRIRRAAAQAWHVRWVARRAARRRRRALA